MNAPVHDPLIADFERVLADTAPGHDDIRLTLFTSYSPKKVTKTLVLDQEGKLTKITPHQMSHGRADVVTLDSIRGLVDLLPTLTPAQSLCYGIPIAEGNRFEVFSGKTLPKEPKPDQIARKKDAMRWPDGTGVLMVDHDPRDGQTPLSRDQLLALLDQVIPPLADVTRVWYPSASSCIWYGDAELAGIKGQRIYVAAKDARDIERTGRVIVDRMWLAGYGWYEVSKSGALLERTMVDASVWQTNRIDFAAGADCVQPLAQRRGDPLVIEAKHDLLDTRELLPDLTAEEVAALERIKQSARAAVAPQAEEAKRAYVVELANNISASDPERFQKARAIAEQAVMQMRLMGDFPLILDDGTILTVGDAMDAREKYHGRLTRDPLEPDYDGGRNVGKLFLIGGRPNLHSFAHGGRNFKLIRAPRRVESVTGRTSDLVDRTLEALRGAPDLFDLGDAAATISNGRVVVLTEATLGYMTGHELQFWCRKKTPAGVEYEADLDPPQKVLRAMLDMGRARKLRPLDAVITAPTIRPDGSILDQPGYDARTHLVFDPRGKSIPAVIAHPSEKQLGEALQRLMMPFESFPFATSLDRSVLLAALLTAAVRPAVPKAPGIAFDAPIQGRGKTLLARCVGIVATGDEPSVWPHVMQSRDADAEIRKRLMTALLKGDGALIWDNIIGVFDSASLAAFLTTPTMTDRILGQSRDATVPNRAIFLASGNNLCLAGDLPRRFLTCRIDPRTDRPFARSFRLDPAAYCLDHRLQMVSDALTIVRAWLVSPEHEFGGGAPGATASFEDWDALVRQPVAWLAERDPAVWRDPLESITASVAADPEAEQLACLLDALHRAFGPSPFTAGDITKHINTSFAANDEMSLASAIEDITGRRDSSTKAIGRVLMNRKDRQSGARRLVSLGRAPHEKVFRWAVRGV